MLDGAILVWFVLTAVALLFVAIDIRTTRKSPVLKWGFVLLTAYTGVVGAFLYVLGCREPFPGTHERFVAVRWRQVLGSTMHCVAGDGVGILAAAVIASAFGIQGLAEVLLEYTLGFAFGWTIFQALFMRGMAGGSYARSLAGTLMSECLSMNFLMAAMVPTMMILRSLLAPAAGPATAAFWFIMSMSLLAGFIVAYPMNWWLVANHLKHGMMTVRSADATEVMSRAGHGSMGMSVHDGGGHAMADSDHAVTAAVTAPKPPLAVMTIVSLVVLAAGVLLARTVVS